ncbi:MAG: transposase [Proteobacteria bacterium]|nr:transposase [Pseudomonadota bacterium]
MNEPKGWHSRGYLPHFDSPETVQFVTFRLADSLPRSVLEGLKPQQDKTLRFDTELDHGLGACWLRRPEIASLVQDALLHFDGERYHLLAWCLMPNHVHVVVEMLPDHSLSEVLRSWKSFTDRRANERLRRTGPFWHADYFDRFMRNEDHLSRTIGYVEDNPVKAGLVDSAGKWPWSSASRRDPQSP